MKRQPWNKSDRNHIHRATRVYDLHQCEPSLGVVSMYSLIRSLKNGPLCHRSWESIRSKFRKMSVFCRIQALKNELKRES